MFPILNRVITVEDASLSDAEVNQYCENGWIVPKWEFPKELINEMRIEYNALLKRNSNLASAIMIAPHQVKGGLIRVVGSEKQLEFATHLALMTIARQLTGNDNTRWDKTIFGKPPQNEKTLGTRMVIIIQSDR